MTVSRVNIYNLALLNLGLSQKMVQDLNDDSTEANVLNQVWHVCKDEALEAFQWNFANKVVELDELAANLPGWERVFGLPPDCLAVRDVWEDGAGPEYFALRGQLQDGRIAWRVMQVDGYKVLVVRGMDSAKVWLEYTADVDDTTLYSNLFVDALGWLLAHKGAAPLTGQPEKAQYAYTMYMERLAAAQLHNAKDNYSGPVGLTGY